MPPSEQHPCPQASAAAAHLSAILCHGQSDAAGAAVQVQQDIRGAQLRCLCHQPVEHLCLRGVGLQWAGRCRAALWCRQVAPQTCRTTQATFSGNCVDSRLPPVWPLVQLEKPSRPSTHLKEAVCGYFQLQPRQPLHQVAPPCEHMLCCQPPLPSWPSALGHRIDDTYQPRRQGAAG